MSAPHRTASPSAVRRRVAEILAAFSAEDLEERVAPVKCAKHPNNGECAIPPYGVAYGVPSDDAPPPPEE